MPSSSPPRLWSLSDPLRLAGDAHVLTSATFNAEEGLDRLGDLDLVRPTSALKQYTPFASRRIVDFSVMRAALIFWWAVFIAPTPRTSRLSAGSDTTTVLVIHEVDDGSSRGRARPEARVVARGEVEVALGLAGTRSARPSDPEAARKRPIELLLLWDGTEKSSTQTSLPSRASARGAT